VILKTLFVLQVHYKFITSVFETYTIIFEQKVNADALLLHFVFFYVFCIGSGLHYKQICYFFCGSTGILCIVW